jgi:hypothetical protein
MKTNGSDDSVPGEIAILILPWFCVFIGLIVLMILRSRWLWGAAYGVAIGLVIFGGVLIFRAKLPEYRRGMYFRFGGSDLPGILRVLYVRGWKFVVRGCLLAGWLLAGVVLVR